jgi:hypothetical protein
MPLNAKITKINNVQAKVINNAGVLSTVAPLTLKNQVQEIRSIEDISDVDEIDVITGSTLVYNSNTDKYEIKLLSLENVAGALDGGTF